MEQAARFAVLALLVAGCSSTDTTAGSSAAGSSSAGSAPASATASGSAGSMAGTAASGSAEATSASESPGAGAAPSGSAESRASSAEDSGEEYGHTSAGAGPRRTAALPTVRLGVAKIVGGLDKTVVRRVVTRYKNQLQFCYEKQLAVNQNLAGTITATWNIDADGKVTNAKATGFDATIAACMAARIATWMFPPPAQGTVTVTYPITCRFAE